MKIAQILYNKVHWLPKTTEDLGTFKEKFSSEMVFVLVSDEVEEGWYWDGTKAIKPKEPEVPLETLKIQKLQQIDSWTHQHIISGFSSTAKGSPHTYDSEEADQLTFSAMYAASKSPDFTTHPIYQGTIPIRAIPVGQTEKVRLGHNATEMQKLSDDLALHIGYCKQIGWALQEEVSLATTEEQVNAVRWPS